MSSLNLTSKSTEELNAIVRALSKLQLLNTPEEDQRLFDAQQELRKRKKNKILLTHTFKLSPINYEYTTPRRHAITNL